MPRLGKNMPTNQTHLFTYSGIPQKYDVESYDIYTEDLVQAQAGPVLAASVSMNLYELCSVDSEDLALLVSSFPSDSDTLSTSSSRVTC